MRPPEAADPLAHLRPYHLPDPVSWWPPAPGWWLLALALLALGAIAISGLARMHRRGAAARAARRELESLIAAFEKQGDLGAYARGVSQLLRRFALTRFPHRELAGLTGHQWLDFLDRNGGSARFRETTGGLLSEVIYRPAGAHRGGASDARALDDLARSWIGHNARRGG